MSDAEAGPAPLPPQRPDRALFVYGTLRRGGSNDIARLAPGATFIADARMRGTLFDLGDYPAMLVDQGAGWVVGEIYAVPDADWPTLDALEEIATPEKPDGLYFRIVADARRDDAIPATCEVYVANPAALRLMHRIDHGDWMAHVARRAR